MAPLIQTWNLTKVYNLGSDLLYAVDNISLEVFQGDMLAVLGRSASGKSTLLHTLGCLLRPDSGRISFEDRDVTQLPEDELVNLRTRKIGFIYQAFNLLPNETLLVTVGVPLQQQGVGAWDRRERAEVALRSVGLGNALDHRPGQLSARQRQCVSIARAIVHEPTVIFADDPTRALDSTSREEVLGLLQKINDQGNTVVLATTDSSVARHCRRVVKIAAGKAVEDSLVNKRRVIPSNRIPGGALQAHEMEVVVCTRCSYGNFKGQQACRRCTFPLELTQEEEKSIEGRLSAADSRWVGVESPSDEGAVPAPELIAELKEVPIFSGLGSKNLIKVAASLELRHFERGSTILKQGGPGDSFHILRQGKVQVVLERDGSPFASVAELGPGEGFGEMALLTGQPRSATVIALTDVETWSLPKVAFEGLLSENLSLALYFNRSLAERLTALQERLIP